MTAADRLDEIEARADAATTAPWSHCLDELRNRTAVHRIGSSEVNADVAFTYRDRDGRGPGMQDAEFIAHARTDVPWLIEQVRKRDAALRAVLDLHKPMRIYEHEDSCEDESEEHREERHVESIESNGEYYCLDLPTGITLCAECSRDLDFDGRDYPCPTVRAVEAALGEVAS